MAGETGVEFLVTDRDLRIYAGILLPLRALGDSQHYEADVTKGRTVAKNIVVVRAV